MITEAKAKAKAATTRPSSPSFREIPSPETFQVFPVSSSIYPRHLHPFLNFFIGMSPACFIRILRGGVKSGIENESRGYKLSGKPVSVTVAFKSDETRERGRNAWKIGNLLKETATANIIFTFRYIIHEGSLRPDASRFRMHDHVCAHLHRNMRGNAISGSRT